LQPIKQSANQSNQSITPFYPCSHRAAEDALLAFGNCYRALRGGLLRRELGGQLGLGSL